MRCFSITAFVSLAVSVSAVWGAPPDRQQNIEQQQQLIQSQQADDQLRQPILDFIKKYQPLQNRYGIVSGLRIATDRLAHLDREREARSVKFWELIELDLPLKQPLTEAQLTEVESFLGTFGAASQAQIARAVIAEHVKLEQAAMASDLWVTLRLKTVDEELTAEQVKGLEEIDNKYPTTETATSARRYLLVHYNRQSRAEARQAGLVAPDNAEALAYRRLADIQEKLGQRRDKSRLQRALAEMVEDYPDTKAAERARAQLVEVQQTIAAAAENARFIRDYWDSVYPIRLTQKRNPE